jgi:hypothetical protein
MEMTQSISTKPALWFWAVALLGLAWNIFGIVQFLGQFGATEAALMGKGMTPEQAALYAAQPMWMTIAFAVGVFGGVFGSILLLMRKRLAVGVFVASLVGYIILYIGDITTGIFKVFGMPQVMILSTVVVIAAALLVTSRNAVKRGWMQ